MPEPTNNSRRVFLCHSWADKIEVRKLYYRLRNDGANPWLDDEDLLPGQDLHEAIVKAIQSSGVVVICLSCASLSKPGFVNKEIGFALDVADEQPEGVIFVIPARLEHCELPLRLRRKLAVDLFDSGGYERLLKSLDSKGLLGARESPRQEPPKVEPSRPPTPPIHREEEIPSPQPQPVNKRQPRTPTRQPLTPLTPDTGTKESNRRTWMIACAALVVVALAIGSWLYFNPPGPRTNPKDGLKYVGIPPGTFRMGCSLGDQECGDDELPAREVQITEGFWLGQTEVPQAAYEKVMGKRSRSMSKGDDLPVEQVTWDEAKQYCMAIGGRLPTEAEWEYAARGGNASSRYGNLDDIAWYTANSKSKTHPVGKKNANRFALYDMLGNASEWTGDWYGKDYYQRNVSRDPKGPENGGARVLRGGSWSDSPAVVRASSRGSFDVTGSMFLEIGFRCVWEQRFL